MLTSDVTVCRSTRFALLRHYDLPLVSWPECFVADRLFGIMLASFEIMTFQARRCEHRSHNQQSESRRSPFPIGYRSY